ncbi:UNVERIFIED_CONTAM: hypothetical protein Sradi_4000300 [Sesamum radiatum]|uniref:Uncharacterized protein n=1 Tax=Sesamum radiatum TaxID=300843 RepID=A0AAW2PH59_SESRA
MEGGLGFRRLNEYNLALLSKQVWRVVMNPDSILHQVLKQRYFLGSNFFAATISSAPSYTWRSLVRSRDLLASGVRWRIGDAQSATIEGHPWPPRPHSIQLIAKPRTMRNGALVAELINSAREWKEELIQSEFLPMDAECILSI